ncbi:MULTISPECIES: ankyrin repeat domain-containing protein [Helcobacillus]|uniref:Ankyrin repeat domain-containing protein n=1 Tax=Helcobacillus massiliensis TaxID=521392 RepID=A0A839QSJ8_9MICO|nr:hypothetical protein [Helcobacillus massiliensis]
MNTDFSENSMPDADAIELANAIMDAARAGELELLRPALDAGAPLDMQNANGDTMIMLAAYHGHTDLVRELIERGADVDRQNDRGQTPIAGAVFKNDIDTVRALKDGGADLDAGNPSARATAEFFQRTDMTELFNS